MCFIFFIYCSILRFTDGLKKCREKAKRRSLWASCIIKGIACAASIPLLSATRLLSPSVAQVVAQPVYISILYTEWHQSCATGICWYHRSNGKWTLKVALKWCPYAHILNLLCTLITLSRWFEFFIVFYSIYSTFFTF